MDFRRISKALPQTGSLENSTQPLNITDIGGNILDALIPGYSIVSRYVQSNYGVDISIFVTTAVIGLAVLKGSQYLYNMAERGFRYGFVSSVFIDEYDDLFDMVMSWLAETQGPDKRRSVRAKTQRGSKLQDEVDDAEETALNDDGMFDYNKWSARTPPRFEPYYGRHFIQHQGRWYLFKRSPPSGSNQKVQLSWSGVQEDDIIQIDCIGRSIAPLVELLRDIKAESLKKMRNTTTIRHPTPKDRARFGGTWSKTFSRPSRPMDTVILDAEQKSMIIRDMNEYLHPMSPKWYATRGIPYRRGYLFHGPPGTGKTSLSFALAGIFGLEIYVISLQEPTLSEGDLMQLFNGLPKRCIVLLEDVDAAGLLRDAKSDSNDGRKGPKRKVKSDGSKQPEKTSEKSKKEGESGSKESASDYTLKDLARELKAIGGPKPGRGRGNEQEQGNRNRAPGTGISLSGLLNAIDGVATHEGRIVILTSNHPEKLDSALVRPGRVDRRIEFRLAMREQIRELFIRMYAASDLVPKTDNTKLNGPQMNGHEKKSSANGLTAGVPRNARTQLDSMSRTDLEDLAAEFAAQLPDDTFTPAEIQNHLMRYKEEPRIAVDKAQDWMKETLEEKEKQAKAKEETDEDGDDDDDDEKEDNE